ncbi:MAG: LuxR C-terminal-related transcriptional regulator [Candidatus Limnocylindria bacterium]
MVFVTETSARLTLRQRSVLRLLARGESDKQIGHRLHIVERTVRLHIAGIEAALGARNRTHAVALACLRRELEPRDLA